MWVQVGWLILGLGSSTFTLKIIWMIHNYIDDEINGWKKVRNF